MDVVINIAVGICAMQMKYFIIIPAQSYAYVGNRYSYILWEFWYQYQQKDVVKCRKQRKKQTGVDSTSCAKLLNTSH